MGHAVRSIDSRRFTKVDLSDASSFLCYLYPQDDDCYVRVLSKSRHRYKSYNVCSLKDPFKLHQVVNTYGREDLFFTLNSFRTMGNMTQANLFAINCIAVDVDFKTIKCFESLTPRQVIGLLELDYFDKKIPLPNVIEYGNQLRLIYKLETTVYVPKDSAKVITLCRRISEEFAKALHEFGADKQGLESYFRFPNSINTKTGDIVQVMYYPNAWEYKLDELQELWLDEVPSWYKKKKGKRHATKQVYKLHNVYSLNMGRLNDFERIQVYLNENYITDYRARLCFLYRDYFLILREYQNGELGDQDYKDAEEALYKFNNQFRYPLRDRAIESATRVVNYRRYLYKNETLVNFLDLDWDLCRELGLESIYKPKTKQEVDRDYHNKNKHKRNQAKKEKYIEKLKEQGKTLKQEEIIVLRQKIKDLREQGLKNKDIAQQLNVSVKKLEKHITFMRKNGLLA